MGGTKIQSSTQTTSVPTPTAEETELNKLQLEQQRAIQPQQTAMQQQAFQLGSQMLQGQQLPGYLQGLPQGVTAEQIPLEAGLFGEERTSDIVQRALRDIYPQFQAMGLPVESGVAQSIAGRTAGDIRTQVGESDLERQLGIQHFNIGTSQTSQYQNLNNLFNLLNLAVGGQAQIQQPVIAGQASLGQRLAGLRTIQETGTGGQRTRGGVSLGILGRWGG